MYNDICNLFNGNSNTTCMQMLHKVLHNNVLNNVFAQTNALVTYSLCSTLPGSYSK